ncbi:MAG: helix-hairpin-helix domain-containing protein [Pseudomonadota bacterium]
MPFSNTQRQILLDVHGVGPKIIERLEQIGIDSLHALAQCNAEEICTQISGLLKSTCWRNSPYARQSIQSAIDTARSFTHSGVAQTTAD